MLAWNSTMLEVRNISLDERVRNISLDELTLTEDVHSHHNSVGWITVVYGPQKSMYKVQFI